MGVGDTTEMVGGADGQGDAGLLGGGVMEAWLV